MALGVGMPFAQEAPPQVPELVVREEVVVTLWPGCRIAQSGQLTPWRWIGHFAAPITASHMASVHNTSPIAVCRA